jgi:hypothetical protein
VFVHQEREKKLHLKSILKFFKSQSQFGKVESEEEKEEVKVANAVFCFSQETIIPIIKAAICFIARMVCVCVCFCNISTTTTMVFIAFAKCFYGEKERKKIVKQKVNSKFFLPQDS